MILTQSVAKAYGAVQALDDVSVLMPAGAITGVLGPNGSGKSTLFRVLLGLTPPDHGVVLVDEVLQPKGPSVERRRIAHVPDSDELYEDLTPGELARLTWSVHAGVVDGPRKFPQARFDRLCDLFGLGEHVGRLSRDLSHGTRRKAQLAATLTCRPQLLVVDEPTNGLDPDQHVVLKLVLRQLAAAGSTIVVSTHNLGFAEDLCDHVVLLRSRVVMSGTPAQVLGRTGTGTLSQAYESLTGIDRERIAVEAAAAFR